MTTSRRPRTSSSPALYRGGYADRQLGTAARDTRLDLPISKVESRPGTGECAIDAVAERWAVAGGEDGVVQLRRCVADRD
jgi:hypothetical protein